MPALPIRPLLALLLFAAPTCVWALEQDRRAPVNIRAQSVELDEKTGIARYRGKVVLTQGSLRIEADYLEARTGGTSRRAQTVTLRGNPAQLRMRMDTDPGEVTAQARVMTLHHDTRAVELEGSAVVRRGGDEFIAERARYLLDEHLLTAEGSATSPVQARLQARPEEKP